MAGRVHVENSGDRKLRSVYECLDFGNSKKALQEADKVLKKHKDSLCAKALKALALVRLGRSSEAFPLLQEVYDEKPTNEATLQAAAMCYRESGKLDLVADIYDNACKAKPDSEELLTQLFMAYVRLGNFKKQQLTAGQLLRLRPDNNPYHYWCVMSIVLQAEESEENLAKTMLLPLAERMAKKRIECNGVESYAEILLMLLILDKLGKYHEALQLLQGPLGECLDKDACLKQEKVVEMLVKLQNWSEANAVYKQLIISNADSWRSYAGYFHSLFAVMRGHEPTTPGDSSVRADELAAGAITFINDRICNCGPGVEGQLQRGPYLAQMELFRLLKECNMSTGALGSVKDLVLNYYRLFGDKYCCFEDLMPFWDVMDQHERSEVLTSVGDDVKRLLANEVEPDFASSVKVMQRHILLLQMQCRLSSNGFQILQPACVSSDELLTRYFKGAHVEKDALLTNLKTCDNYLLLGVLCILDTWVQNNDQALLLKACIWLETGACVSPANYHFKILLIKVYSELGVFSPVPRLLTLLDIKHIQNDSLGYLFCNDAVRWGHISSASSLLSSVLKFLTTSGREVSENLVLCFRYGSFTKIEEFIKFKKKLQNSCQFAMATVERLLIDLIAENNRHPNAEQKLSSTLVDPELDTTDWTSLVDNRDLDVLPQWTAPGSLYSAAMQEASFKEEKAWLKFRNLTVRILSAAMQMTAGNPTCAGSNCAMTASCTDAPQSANIKAGKMATALSNLLTEYDKHLWDCSQSDAYREQQQFHTHGPSPTRLRLFLQLGHAALLSRFGHLVLYALNAVSGTLPANGADAEAHKEPQELAECYKKISGASSKHIVTNPDNANMSIVCLHPDVLEDNVLHVEMLAYYAMILGACWKILQCAGANPPESSSISQSKRKGKKKQQPSESDGKAASPQAVAACSALRHVVDNLVASASALEGHLTSMSDSVQTLLLPEHVNAQLCLEQASDTSARVDPLNKQDTTLPREQQEQVSRRAMWTNIENSYQQTLKETLDLLKHQILFLQALKF